jgi:hypothetical protein
MIIPTVEETERIAGIPDPVVRNLNITQCYYELSKAMGGLTGIYPSWCTFAVWASKQAGQSIRKEDLIRTFRYYFRHSPEVESILKDAVELVTKNPEIKTLIDSILDILGIEEIFELTSKAVAEGNKKVFEEIGSEFARFLSAFRKQEDFTSENITAFCNALKPGAPPDGQQFLNEAFTAYYESRQLQDPITKAQILHYANLLIGYHEQIRLQPEIVEAMYAPLESLDDFRYKIFKQFLPGIWLHIRYFISKLFGIKFPLDEVLDGLLDLLKHQVREVITRFMMSLYIPGCPVLRLGEDLKRGFSQVLMQISNAELKKLLIKIDPTPDSLKESSALDWGDFKDRIHFIVDFFRCFFEYPHLFDPPFTGEKTADLKAGSRPEGNL